MSELVCCPFCDKSHRVLRSSVSKDVNEEQHDDKEDPQSPTATVGKVLGGGVLAAGVAGLVSPIVANAGLKGAGFTSKGIGRGSVASKIQSRKGNIEKNSTFSNVQSFGAKGGFSQFGWLALGGALVAGAAALGFGAYHYQEEQKKQKEEELRNENNICMECWELHKQVFIGGATLQ